MWCEEILVTNRSTPVLSTDAMCFRAASSPEDIIRGIIGVKGIGAREKYWVSPCNAAVICNPFKVKAQRSEVDRFLVTTVNWFHWFDLVDTGGTPSVSLASGTAQVSRIS
jgi:hypothetical protein